VYLVIANGITIIKYEEHVISKCVSELKFVNPVNTSSTIIEGVVWKLSSSCSISDRVKILDKFDTGNKIIGSALVNYFADIYSIMYRYKHFKHDFKVGLVYLLELC
jgi:hypothetical protein